MPIVQAPSKVLVTGANGFIAVWVVQSLLERGYSVRGTVRSESKGEHLKRLFSSYGDKLELVVVEDITKDGAFDEAVKGVDTIEHTASPVQFNATTPDEIIDPAVKGTVGILNSALKHGSSVKRIVITSSAVAIFNASQTTPTLYSEADWNETAIRQLQTHGVNTSASDTYYASKTLAEKAAWRFVRDHQAEINWDIVVLNPPYVFGPTLHEVSSPAALNSTTKMFYDALVHPNSSGRSDEDLASKIWSYIDVRDLAKAHVVALQKEEASNERTIVYSGHTLSWQQFLDIANVLNPHPLPSHTGNLPKGNPGASEGLVTPMEFDTAKFERIYGFKLKSVADTVRDTFADFEKKGW